MGHVVKKFDWIVTYVNNLNYDLITVFPLISTPGTY